MPAPNLSMNAIEAKPFLKWVGGKRQLLPALLPHLKALGFAKGVWTGRYFEPFLGGGAVLFAVSNIPGFHGVANDYNDELVTLYRVVKNDPEALHRRLQDSVFAATLGSHGSIRAWDRLPDWSKHSELDHAARFIYLNRTSFNGVWRVNSKGYFNVPFNKNPNPGFPSLETLKAASLALSKVELSQGDFEASVADAVAGDLVYLDPPYIPVSASANFTGYTAKGFDAGMQERLARMCDRLTEKGVSWILSNADVPLAHELYGRQPNAVIHKVLATRALNRNGQGRGRVGEIIAVCPSQ